MIIFLFKSNHSQWTLLYHVSLVNILDEKKKKNFLFIQSFLSLTLWKHLQMASLSTIHLLFTQSQPITTRLKLIVTVMMVLVWWWCGRHIIVAIKKAQQQLVFKSSKKLCIHILFYCHTHVSFIYFYLHLILICFSNKQNSSSSIICYPLLWHWMV